MPTAPTRVLLVEGDDALAGLVGEALAHAGPGAASFDLRRVETLAGAVAALGERSFEVVVLDLSLPDSHGLETFRRLHAEAPDVAVLVLGDTEDEELATRTVHAGAQDHLTRAELSPGLLVRALRYAVERHRTVRQLRSQALADDLTGVHNRRGFLLVAEHQLRVADRTGRPALLLYVDLDGMKAINDTFGHPEGDNALRDTAALLSSTLRDCDVVGRLGGDELCALLVDEGDAPDAVARRLHDAVDAHNASGKRPFALSLSIGGVRYEPERPCSIEELVDEADRLMYECKRGDGGDARRPRLLVVADDRSLHALCRQWFGRDFDVVAAGTGGEGVHLAAEQRPAVVLLDLGLPDMSGTEAARLLRGRHRTARVPMVVLTAADGAEIDGLPAGVDDYVVKPVVPEVLRARVDNLLRRPARR